MITIINDRKTFYSKMQEKALKNTLNRYSKRVHEILNNFNIEIIIKPVFTKSGTHVKGSYIMEKEIVQICIDSKCNIENTKFVLGHEIGHLIDEYLGCIVSNKPFNESTRKHYKLSKIDSNFKDAALIEDDLYMNGENEEYRLAEYFADCFSDLISGKRFFKSTRSKDVIRYNLVHFLN